MERVDLKIGFLCNNHCKFCVQGQKRNSCDFKKEAELKKNLKESFLEGKREVVFTGGEPTLHPSFLNLVAFAKQQGYEVIQIQTNGRSFSYFDFCVKTIKAGATEFSPSLHGHNAAIHDFLTEAPGSFDQTVKGILNLKKLNQYVLTNSVITAKNYKFLPQMARLLVKLGVRQMQFAFIHLGGRAFENRKWITPRKTQIMPYLKKALDIGLKAKRTVTVEAVPYCLLKGYEDFSSETRIPDIKVYDAGFVIDDFTKHRKEKGKLLGPSCKKCKYAKICEGPWKEYPGLFGWKEFKPVKD